MENSILLYLLKVNLGISLAYLLHKVFLNKNTFNGVRRWYFWGIIVFSFLYPFIDMTWFKISQPTILYQVSANTVLVSNGATNKFSEINYSNIAIAILIIFSSLLLLRLFSRTHSIYALARKAKEIKPVNILCFDEEIKPFSFFKWTFINEKLYSPNSLQEILLHEQIHIKNHHSLDVILSEIVCIICWINPFAWLLQKEIKINLEYLADQGVIDHGSNKKLYQYHLVRLATSETTIQLVNNFNVSQLKNRIIMMNKKKSSRKVFLSYLLVFPLSAVLLVLNQPCTAQNASPLTQTLAASSAQNDTVPTSDPKIVYIVDGVYKDQITDLSPNDIASMSVLKNATAVKMYGPGGENGVVIVTTKQGDASNTENKDDKPLDYAEVMPQYPGENNALSEFLQNNLVYPSDAAKKGIQGMCVVKFVIEKDGTISYAKVTKSLSPSCDAEALRVVKMMPKWKPGKQKGKPVAVICNLPIVFKLADQKGPSIR